MGSTTGINGLRIEAGGSLCAYDGIHTNTCGNTSTQGAQVIYFNSAGTNPIGGGSVTNPGSDATAFGLFISYGTFQFLGDANDQLTLTPANTSYPIYVVHEFNAYSGGIGIGTAGETGGAAQSIHGGALTCRYCRFVNVGSPAFPATMEGLAYELLSATVRRAHSITTGRWLTVGSTAARGNSYLTYSTFMAVASTSQTSQRQDALQPGRQRNLSIGRQYSLGRATSPWARVMARSNAASC